VREFRPINLNPGQQGVVAVHLLMSNCTGRATGGYTIVDSISVDYSVLGFPHTQDVPVGPYRVSAPDTCGA
jgi:hypothetical protein